MYQMTKRSSIHGLNAETSRFIHQHADVTEKPMQTASDDSKSGGIPDHLKASASEQDQAAKPSVVFDHETKKEAQKKMGIFQKLNLDRC